MFIIRRSHFQLLEVLVAVFLIAICAMPVLSAYIRMNHMQFENARLYERDHFVHLVHAKIVEGFYRKKIRLSEIQEKKMVSWKDVATIFDEEDRDQLAAYAANQFEKMNYECFYQLHLERPLSQLQANHKQVLVGLTILLNDVSKQRKQDKNQTDAMSYHYSIYAKLED